MSREDAYTSKLLQKNLSDEEIKELLAKAREDLKNLPDKLASIEAAASAKMGNKEIKYDEPKKASPAKDKTNNKETKQRKNTGKTNKTNTHIKQGRQGR